MSVHRDARKVLGSTSLLSLAAILVPGAMLVDVPFGHGSPSGLPFAGAVVNYAFGLTLLYPVSAGLLFLYMSSFPEPEDPSLPRRILVGFLAASVILVTLPWIHLLLVAEPVFSTVTGVTWAGVLAAASLAAAVLVGFGRRTLFGPRFLASSVLTILGIVLVLVGGAVLPSAADYPDGAWLAIPALFGGILFTGLVLQYPSMLWYAWSTPADEWEGEGSTEEGSPATGVQFEQTTGAEDA